MLAQVLTIVPIFYAHIRFLALAKLLEENGSRLYLLQ